MLLQQMLMMIWEAVLEFWQIVVVLIGLLLASWLYAVLIRRLQGRFNHRLTAIIALVMAVVGFFILPSLFSAHFDDLTYWVDWAFHLAMVFGVFIYAYLLTLPLSKGVR